jgi:membrane protein
MGGAQTRDYEARGQARPEPDEAELEPSPLSPRGLFAAAKRAAKEMLADNMTMMASALAYSIFFAIPAVLLVVVGLFTLIASPQTITTLMDKFAKVMPDQATQLLDNSLQRLERTPSTSIAITAVGFVLALWAVSGAMNSLITAVNIAYDEKDTRNFVRKRAIAIVMAAVVGLAFLLVAVLLVLGPQVEKWVGSAIGHRSLVHSLWWVTQWPILIFGLLAAFATVLYLAPNLPEEDRRWKFITPGAVVAAAIWLAVSGAFAYYTSRFGSYDKTWGSLSAVIITLTWLWLSSLALLFGAEFNAEIEMRHQRRRGSSPRA